MSISRFKTERVPRRLGATLLFSAALVGFLFANPAYPQTITTFDAPGAGTRPVGINPSGVIAGSYNDASGNHGFVRDSGGAITTFDVPGATQGTVPVSINPSGAIAGSYFDASFLAHGFVRDSLGAITTFDVPGAIYGTFPRGINPSGATTGYYIDASGARGFVRFSLGVDGR